MAVADDIIAALKTAGIATSTGSNGIATYGGSGAGTNYLPGEASQVLANAGLINPNYDPSQGATGHYQKSNGGYTAVGNAASILPTSVASNLENLLNTEYGANAKYSTDLTNYLKTNPNATQQDLYAQIQGGGNPLLSGDYNALTSASSAAQKSLSPYIGGGSVATTGQVNPLSALNSTQQQQLAQLYPAASSGNNSAELSSIMGNTFSANPMAGVGNDFNFALAASIFAAPELAALGGLGGIASSLGDATGLTDSVGAISDGLDLADAVGAGGSAAGAGAAGAAGVGSLAGAAQTSLSPLEDMAYSSVVPETEAGSAAGTGAGLGSQFASGLGYSDTLGAGTAAAGATGAGAAAGSAGGLLSSLTSNPLSLASLISSGVTAGSGIVGSLIGSNAQTSAANSASATQQNMFNQIMQNLSPYMQTGAAANASLNKLTGAGTADPLSSPLLQAPTSNINEAALAGTPGYQFNLTQGQKAVNNAASARGLANSGAALKGAASYGTGLADSTYQNQYSNAVTNQTNQFNRLLSLSQNGQSAATGAGGLGTQTATNIGNNTIGAGNATAAAASNGANAIGTGASNITNNLLLSQLLQGKIGQGSGIYGSIAQGA